MTAAVQLSTTARLRALASLTKPGIVLMTTMTAAWGVGLAPTSGGAARTMTGLIGAPLCVAGANVFNMVIERDTGRHMERTRGRPLARDAMAPGLAFAWGTFLTLLSLGLLALASPVPLAMGVTGFAVYGFAYTPLKRVTPLALLVGCVAGSMPPLIGWPAATGSLNAAGLALGGMLFAWRIAHFLASSLFPKHEHARAPIRAAGAVCSARLVRNLIRASAALFLCASLAPVAAALSRSPHALVALAAGIGLLALTWRRGGDDAAWARNVFRGSVVHLPALAMIADRMVH